jgi:DnaJ-class molecular chaperone
MTANEPVEKDQEPMSRDHHPPGRSPRARPPSPYEILRVRPGASPAELRRAYRAAARNLHPDTNPSPDAAAQFAALHQAWRALTDPGSQTDRHGHRGVGTIVFARRRPLPHRLWAAVCLLVSRRRRPPRVR